MGSKVRIGIHELMVLCILIRMCQLVRIASRMSAGICCFSVRSFMGRDEVISFINLIY